jgi:acid phosphatase type 7
MKVLYRTATSLALLAVASLCHASGIAKGPYLQNPTTSAITVCWVSDEETTGTVEYLPDTDSRSDFTGANTARDKAKAQYHKVRLTGLKPYTRYRYRVTCDSRISPIGTFKTAAPLAQPFKFIAYGDTRTQPNVHADVLRRMGLFEPDFVIQSGDLVADGENQVQWDEYWRTAERFLLNVPMYPALGNHERGGAPYFRYFEVPQEYSFDYGNVHFVALNSNRPASEHAAQEEWLRKDLAAHQSATWRVAFFHHTLYTCTTIASRREQELKLRARLEPIFKAGNVQLVVNGHDHNYQHHVANGIHYVVSGGGGAPLYDVNPDTPFVKKAKKTHHHCELSVDGPKMSVRAVEPDGSVIEAFDIRAD